MSGERWAVAGERNSYGNPEHLLWPDDQDPDLPHRFTESHFAEAWPNTEDSIVAPAFAALVQAVRDAERLRSSPSDPPLMQVDHAHPVPSSPDSGESRLRAAGPESEHADTRRAGAPPPEASSYACERAARVELTADELDQMLVGQALSDARRLRSLAATFDSHLNRDKTFTGSEVASMLRDGKG